MDYSKIITNPEDIRQKHLLKRKWSEHDFFNHFINLVKDESNPIFLEKKGDINNKNFVDEIIELDPDLIVLYGCSLIKDPLINAFENRVLNVHLGLSPYYRGSGTNFWPLVNKEPEYVGATFMYADAGVDTGKIIHQIRAEVKENDTPHTIGNRLIASIPDVYRKIIVNYDNLEKIKQLDNPEDGRLYRKKDFSKESVVKLYKNFKEDMCEEYLRTYDKRIKNVPIIKNPVVE